MYIGDIRLLYRTDAGRDAILAAYDALLAEKGGINAPGSEGELKLGEELAFLAANFTDPEALERLFNLGVDPQVRDHYASTLLHEAAKRREHYRYKPAPGDAAKTAELLLDKGVSALRKDDNERMCCYHYAARAGMWEFVEALAKRGIRLNMTDKEGNTGIHIAADYVRHELYRLGLEDKARRQEKAGEYRETVENYFKTVKAFVDAGGRGRKKRIRKDRPGIRCPGRGQQNRRLPRGGARRRRSRGGRGRRGTYSGRRREGSF